MLTPPPIHDMFGDAKSDVEATQRFEAYKGELRKSHAAGRRGEFRPKAGLTDDRPANPAASITQAVEDLEKSASPDLLASLGESLAQAKVAAATLTKDWTETNPFPTGPVPFDLQAPAKLLVNRKTPLRQRLVRTEGKGEAARFKRLTGWSNSGQGGVANLSPFMVSASQSVDFGPTPYRRGNKISLAASESVVLYKELGLSDQIDDRVFYASKGFEDLDQLSHTALLWSTMTGEELAYLYGRGSDTGYAGALAAPTGVSLAAVAAGAGQTGNTADIATLYVYVCANSGFGGSVASTVVSSTALSAAIGDVVNVTYTGVSSALSYDIFCGTAAGIANAYYAGSSSQSGTSAFTINFTGGGTGGCPNSGSQPPASDASANIAAFDGLLTVQSNPALSGYANVQNAAWSTSSPGTEFQTAFETLYGSGSTNNLADPDEIIIHATARQSLSSLLTATSANGYRINIGDDNRDVTIGNMVTAIQNEVTGKVVPMTVHPYIPKGCALIMSWTLPVPDSEISNTVEVRCVQDLYVTNWPRTQFTRDSSTYALETMVHYAPAWSGAITGIKE